MRFRTKNNSLIESTLTTHFTNYFILKFFPPQDIDWNAYAKQYNLVTRDLKPSYKEIISLPFHFEEIVKRIKSGRLAYDVGAGTGNLSIQIARSNPNLQVAHIDYGREFIDIAKKALENAIRKIPIKEIIILNIIYSKICSYLTYF